MLVTLHHMKGAARPYKSTIGCQCRQEMGEIPNFTDSERFKTPKTDFLLKFLRRQKVLSAWIPGLLTFKIQRSVPPGGLHRFTVTYVLWRGIRKHCT